MLGGGGPHWKTRFAWEGSPEDTRLSSSTSLPVSAQAAQGALDARPGLAPGDHAGPPLPPGVTSLGGTRPAWIYLPPQAGAGRAVPLVVMLHGAGGSGREMLSAVQDWAAAGGLAVLTPTSLASSWDLIQGALGPDVAAIDRALALTFARVPVDPDAIALGGFSDGASYALSLGIANGALFEHVIAFSPGFARPPRRQGNPRIFVSHGRADRVLPIDACSRALVPRLERAGYEVTYREFDGPHTIPPAVADEALRWLRPAS